MKTRRTARKFWNAALALAASTVILSTTCTADNVRAVAVGLESASRELENQNHRNDITFGEWLLSELDR